MTSAEPELTPTKLALRRTVRAQREGRSPAERERVAQSLATLMTGLPGGWITFMAVTIVVFLILGSVLEGLPAIVLMAPLMFPIAKNLGINDIHYAMVMVTAMNIGLMAPPIGIGFYLACKIGNVSPDEAIGAIWPYLVALLVGLIIIALVPWISTGLL